MTRSFKYMPILIVALLVVVVKSLSAQEVNPVYVDDSPRAWELFRLAGDQAADNEGEAVRLYQELLDEYGAKLIPRHEAARDQFLSVRSRVLDALLRNDNLLARYRVIQQAEGERLLAADQLRSLALTRSLTDAGLEALLRLGQRSLESARFNESLGWLNEAQRHPALSGRAAAHCWYMIGLAQHYLGRVEGAEEALSMLRQLGSPARDVLPALEMLVKTSESANVRIGQSPLDRTHAEGLSTIVAQTIWSQELPASLHNRRFSGDSGGGATFPFTSRRQLRGGSLTTAAPTIAGNVLYVNEGHAIRALDRFSGRSIWERPFEDRRFRPGMSRDDEGAGDLSIIALEGDALVTLTGHAFPNNRSDDGRVLCIDARTGNLRWEQSLNQLDRDVELEGLFPVGAPLILEGRVVVLARHVTAQSLIGCYVVAFDLATGELQWIRLVASSGSRGTARDFSNLASAGGRLYIMTPAGAAARLDPATGQFDWLRRYTTPLFDRSRDLAPWEIGGPVVTERGVVALTPDRRRIVLLDQETGDELETHDAQTRSGWNAPAYFLATGEFVYGIGTEIRAFHIEDLDAPLWRLPQPAQSIGLEPGEVAPALAQTGAFLGIEDVEIAGRVQATDDALIAPTATVTLIVEHDTGRVAHALPAASPGNPVAFDSQIAIATADALDVYMSLERAEAMLRQRVAERPSDPEPAMTLLQLGVRVGNLPLALEAADLTRDALAQMQDASASELMRRRLFSMLLEIHHQAAGASRQDREKLYRTLAVLAVTPVEKADHLFARGQWLENTSARDAVEVYQRVLSEPELGSAFRDEDGRAQSAARWAADRIAALIESNGPAIYAAPAERAQRRLGDLVAIAQSDHEALMALAVEFPFADAGIEAALRAAGIRVLAQNSRGAIRDLARAYHLAPTDVRAKRLLGPLVGALVNTGRTSAASESLALIIGQFGNVRLETQAGPRDAVAWLQALSPTRDSTLPEIGTQTRGEAALLNGNLLMSEAAAGAQSPANRLLMLEGQTLRLLRAHDLQPRWATTLTDPDATLLRMDERQILLYIGAQRQDPTVVAIDASNGNVQWTTPRLENHLPPPLSVAREVQSLMPNGNPFEPRETLALATDDVIYFVQRTGGVAAFDRQGSPAPLWTTNQPKTIEQVHHALLSEFDVVLIGLDRALGPEGAAMLVPRVAVVDRQSGAIRYRMDLRSTGGVAWAAVAPMGTLLCGSESGIEAIDLWTGERRWLNHAPATQASRRGWLAANHAVFESRTSWLFGLDLERGTLTDRFDNDVRGDWDPLALDEILPAGDASIYARYQHRLIRYDRSGSVLGADIVTDSRDYRAIARHQRGVVLLSLADTSSVLLADGTGRRGTRRSYRLYFLSENCRLEREPIDLSPMASSVQEMVVIEGWLLLATRDNVIAIPFPIGP